MTLSQEEARAILESLRRMKLLDPNEDPILTPLAGGVSSEIVKADTAGGSICIKRALSKLKVAAGWYAPTGRNRTEYLWLKLAQTIAPDASPRILGDDPEGGAFAMEFLAPDEYPVWKSQLRDGIIETSTAQHVGERLALIHASTAFSDEVARSFATDDAFFSLRLEPYLAATAIACPRFATPLNELIARTSSTKHALVHGDISPKNILCGANGPVFLDAECAWYGDPAFDLAFCLNHLLLKCAWRPVHTDRYVACYDALSKAYLSAVDWEPPSDIANRTATLLPALMLARIKGKSPVEYLTTQPQRDLVCAFAGEQPLSMPQSLEVIGTNWKQEVPH